MSKTGSCLCGEVSFTYKSEPGMFLMCHCTDCQKSTGSPVASIIIVPEDDFSVKGSTSSYECEAKVTRSFVKFAALKFLVDRKCTRCCGY
jgi:hypothetical protein